ncbi:unnamed protein product [Penicillium nalgiovense]|uniref:Uncharacterized protein n=1 Tax=Penicillium nalgiovense TaxID=60175 RepID=A0A1V6Y225_PENNA|nr:hypothetical protein PENNAL_c0041G03185 [Penicillium nalgiovense]CAG7938973.1 unnamed protein product [Penicillium nalgiovense]CAG7941818.1 unnamed protein product [Penicillium nalgiovense]CAG7953621.1 unnamed protein product [Penicillium nalgiovense]CAG7962338.1 unnamed protein product [Penicillium nalgiovense]
MSFSHKEPEVLPSGNTVPQVPQQDRTSQSLSQRVSQPENSESKDYAMNSESVENRENAEKTMDQGRRGTAAIMEDHHVSREALKGPQGQPPHTAEEFKKEMETGKAAGGSHSGDSTEAKGSRGEQGTMEKVKERLAHPLHGKK